MFKKFYPDNDVASAYEIDYKKLYAGGYRGIIYDIDNTLVMHGKPADERCISFIKGLKEIGFKVIVMSNNQIDRVQGFASQVAVPFIEDAHKPLKKSYYKAMEMIGTDVNNTIFVGDQLFTDIYGAKRCGITNYLVRPIHKSEEIQIVLKRRLEKIVLKSYYKNKRS